MRVVWHNGKIIPESEAKLSIYSSGLMFGDVVFEMTRSFNKEHFKLRAHLQRLYAGIKILRIPIKMCLPDLEAAVAEITKANAPSFCSGEEYRVMINVDRGLLSIYEGIADVPAGPNVMISVFPLHWTVASMGPLFDKGISAVIPSQRSIPGRLLDPKIKSRSRLHYLMANLEVSQVKGSNNWALLLDEDGFISEGTGDNFFIVKDGVVITPEGRNVLRGISRAYIMEICKRLGLPCVEKNIEPYDVYHAEEAWMSGTPFCMLPVSSLNGIKIGSGVPNFWTYHRLLDEWSQDVGVDIREQIQGYEKYKKDSLVTPYQFKER